jgi:hypothetical protein
LKKNADRPPGPDQVAGPPGIKVLELLRLQIRVTVSMKGHVKGTALPRPPPEVPVLPIACGDQAGYAADLSGKKMHPDRILILFEPHIDRFPPCKVIQLRPGEAVVPPLLRIADPPFADPFKLHSPILTLHAMTIL